MICKKAKQNKQAMISLQEMAELRFLFLYCMVIFVKKIHNIVFVWSQYDGGFVCTFLNVL